MVRTSKNQPSSLDAGALDDLDLDDMFADDGDMLFEGLDIQMDGMGDIITTESSSKAKDGNDYGNDSTTPSNRRTTKRKTKTPVAFGDEDDDYVEETTTTQAKKRRKTSLKAGKAHGAATAAAAVATAASISSKRKKKGPGDVAFSTTTTNSKTKNKLLVSTTFPSATVAAAGRFGKRGGGPVVAAGGSGKATKRKSKSSNNAWEGGTNASSNHNMSAPPPLFVPKQESIYGGLHPSKTHFYPFLESVPPEPTLKSRKQFPLFDKIFQALNAVVNQAGTVGPMGQVGVTPIIPDLAAASAAGLNMESPIVQLLLESFEAISEKDKQSFGESKKQALLGSIPELKKTIEGMDLMKLLADLYGMCALLTRQYNFIKTSLTNMETWCKATFTDADFRQAYSLPEPFRPERVGTIITAANRKWRKSIIPLKVSFMGYKGEPKGTPVLLARLPPGLVLPSKKETSSSVTSSATAKSKKKKTTTITLSKSSAVSASTAKSAAAVLAVPKPPTAPKSYVDCSPPERRQRILEKVAQLALGLESQLNFGRAKRSPLSPSVPSSSLGGTPTATSKTNTTSGDVKAGAVALTASKIPLEEESPLHTAQMWEWLEAAGFFHSKPATKQLRLQSPEIYPRGFLLPTPHRILGRQVDPVPESSATPAGNEDQDKVDSSINTQDEKGETIVQISSTALYDRLLSLLVVEEDSSLENREECAQHEDDSDMESENDEDDDSLSFLDDDSDEEYINLANPTRPLADLSKLSMEERAFLHLSSVGLIKKSLFPLVELVLEDGVKDDTMEDDLVNVIGEMSEDLSTLTARNNARIAYLESAMDPVDISYRKQLEEEQASIIARCQGLMKRSKEKAKKSNRQKSSGGSSTNGLNLPW